MVSELGSLVKFQPAAAKAKILEALRAEGCHKGKTAKRLGCTHGTLCLWINQLAMTREIDLLVAEAMRDGWRATSAGQGGSRRGAGRPAKAESSAKPKARSAKPKSSARSTTSRTTRAPARAPRRARG